jgi:hypothetical protein
MLEDLDYGCAFKQKEVDTKKGTLALVCRGGKLNSGCCGGCLSSAGYHYGTITNEPDGVRLLQKEFKKRTLLSWGYWRMGVGCTLPRRYRSFVCNHHICHDEGNKSKDLPILREIHKRMRNPHRASNNGRFAEARKTTLKVMELYKQHRGNKC